MALPDKRLPIQLTGLNNKSDDKNAPEGSFVKAENIFYDKLGRIDRRLAYKNLKINSENINFLPQFNGQQLKYFTKIGRYNDKTLLLKPNSLYGGLSLFDQTKTLEADNISTNLHITNMASKTSFNSNSQQECYSETYQNVAYSRNFNLSCLVNVETIKSELNIKIIREDNTLYTTAAVGGGVLLSTNPVFHTKVLAFENTSTGSTGIVYNNITFLIFVHNTYVSGGAGAGTTALNIFKISGYCVQGQEQNVNQFYWSPLGIIKRAGIGQPTVSELGSTVVEKLDDQTGCFATPYQITLSSTVYYGYLETFVINTTVNDTPGTDPYFAQNTTYLNKGQIGIPPSISNNYTTGLYALKNISNPADNFYTLAFASTSMGTISRGLSPGNSPDHIDVITFRVPFSTLIPIVYFYVKDAAIIININENGLTYYPLIVNMAFGNYSLINETQRDFNAITPFNLYVTTTVGHHRDFTSGAPQTTEYASNSVYNRVRNFGCAVGPDARIIAIQEGAQLQNHTLASGILSLNGNDYFLTTFNDVYQASYFLCGYNKITGKFKVINQFFYQNAGITHNLDISNLTQITYNDSYCSGIYSKNINYGWTTSLILKDINNALSVLTTKNIIAAISYRDNFYKPGQSFALGTLYNANPYKPSGQSYYSTATYDGYVSACSSRLVTIDLVYSKGKNLKFNNNTYITGGYLSTYDGNNLNRHGFSTYPVILSNPTPSIYKDPIGEPPIAGFAVYGGFNVTSASGNNIFLSGITASRDGSFPIKVGDIFRLAVGVNSSYGGLPSLGDSLTEDTSFFFNNSAFYSGTVKTSTEMVVAQVLPLGGSGDNFQVIIADVPGSGSAASFNYAAFILAPYGVLLRKKQYNFVAVYRYYDNNHNEVFSAPSITYGYSYNLRPENTRPGSNGLAYISITVSNYVQPNQPYKVVIELYRTIGDSLSPAFYLCGTYENPDDLSAKPDFVTIYSNITDTDLITKKQLYTNGGELETIPVSNPYSVTTKDNRFYAVQGEDKNTIWYSKQLIPGEEVQFNDALTKKIITKGGDILAIEAMDEKIIIFKEEAIYYFAGDGANNLGQNESFSDTQIIYNNIGLDKNQPQCILLIDQGIIFKSSKGLYLIPRGMGELQYIGAGIEDQVRNGIYFTKIIGNNKRNEIKIGITSLTSSGIYTFNFEQNVWYSEFMASAILDLDQDSTGNYALFSYNTFVKSGTVYLANNPVKQEDVGGAKDFDDFSCGLNLSSYVPAISGLVTYKYQESMQTNWINLNGIQNFGRLRRLFMLGQNISGDLSLKITIEYDFVTDGSNKEVHSWTESTTANSPLQVEIHLARQKCQAIRINIESVTGLANNFNISNILAAVAFKQKLPLPSTRIK